MYCNLFDYFTGTQELVLSFHQTAPQVSVLSSSKTFQIAITELRELDAQSRPVSGRSITLPALNFTLNQVDKIWTYHTTSLNGLATSLTITFEHHVAAFEYEFANLTVSRPANTLKLSATITKWNFNGIRNKLALVMKSDVVQSQDACFKDSDSVFDPNNNLIWLKDEVEGVTLYGQFLQNAIVDARTVQLINNYNRTSDESLIIIPNFFDSAGKFIFIIIMLL